MSHACDGVVVEVYVRDFDVGRQAVGIDSETVIVRSDLDLAGRKVFYRLVAAAMAEFEFVGLAAEGFAEKLVAKADAKDRRLAFCECAYLGDRCLH